MTPEKGAGRAVRLLVARESSTQDMPMLENMVAQTVGHYPEIPEEEARVILQAGVRPLDDKNYPDRQRFTEGGSTAVLYRAGDTWVLISKGSATKIDVKKENGFTSILCQVLETLQPRELLLATFSRMIRSATLSGTLLAACEAHVDVVKCREQQMTMRSGEGRLMWQFLAMIASSERDAQMTRLTLGRLAKHRRGLWCWTPSALPLGWKLESGVPRLDDQAVPLVRRLLELLADPAESGTTILAELGRLGLRSPSQTTSGEWQIADDSDDCADLEGQRNSDDSDDEANRLSEDATLAGAVDEQRINDLSNGAGRVRKFYRALPVYETGTYLTRWKVPVSATNLAEYAVVPADEDFDAHVPVVYQLPLPEGGFASRETFAAAHANLVRNQERYGAADRSVTRLPLLAGPVRRFDVQGTLCQLRSYWTDPGAAYGIFPVVGRSSTSAGAIAAMDGHELAAAVAEAAIAAIRDGTTFAHLDAGEELRSALAARAGRTPSAYRRIQELEQHAHRLRMRVSVAVERSLSPTVAASATLVERFLADAASADAELADVLVEIEGLRAAAEADEPAIQGFSVESDLVAALLAGLAKETKPVPRAVAAAFTDLIGDLRFEPGAYEVKVGFKLRLPAAGGWVESGELTAGVRNRVRGDGVARAERVAAATALWMTSETTITDLAGRPGRDSGLAFREDMVGELRRLGLAGGSPFLMTLHPVLLARQALWSRLASVDAPAGASEEFVEQILDTYKRRASPARTWLHSCTGLHQAVLTLLRDAGTTVPRRDFQRLLVDSGFQSRVLDSVSRAGIIRLPRGAKCSGAQCTSSDCATHGLVTPVPCPHCSDQRWADHALAVPEIPSKLLCRTCRKAPVLDSPEYPEAYLHIGRASYDAWLAATVPDVVSTRAARRGVSRSQQLRQDALRLGIPVSSRGRISKETQVAVAAALRTAS